MRSTWFIFLFFFTLSVAAQNIDQLQSEIEQSQSEINRISIQLASNRDQQIETNTKIKLLEKRLKLRQNLVKQTSTKILSLDKQMKSYDAKVLSLGILIDSLKGHVHQAAVSHNQNFLCDNDFPEYYSTLLSIYILSSHSFIDSLDQIILKTGIARSQIERQKKEMNQLLISRKTEVDQIIKESKEIDSLKKSLKLGESKMLSQIESHRSKINQLQREIERLVSLDNSISTSENVELTNSFKNSVGNLPSPLSVNCRIVDSYGIHDHPTINGVKVSNNGVNLSFFGSSFVKSIADGEVRGIYNIGGLASTIIVRHGQFLSVYSNLHAVFVSKGDLVTQGQFIGKIQGADTDELFLHFELWQETKNLNPVQWVRF